MAWDDIPEWSFEVAQQLLDEVRKKDEFTFHHCCRVGRGSRRLGKAMGLNVYEQAILEYSGLFHDIGKARIPVEILVKPGRLDKAEIEVMKSHPELSAEMIMAWQHVPFFRFLLPGIRYHHEKIDGGGYPNAIRGEAIPLFARIIAVVDGFDAMTNQRPYRNPLPEEKAIQEIRDFSGKQFDMRIAAEFLKLLPEYKKEDQKENSQELVVARLIKAA